MEGWLSFLIFAGLFYLMMRFGCGSHMIHGHGHAENHSHNDDKNNIDPVCGMDIDPEKGYGKMHAGHLYRFCSHKCLDKFESEPEKYIKGDES